MKSSFLAKFSVFCDETLQVQTPCVAILFVENFQKKTVCPLLDVSITFPYKQCSFEVEGKTYQRLSII